MTTNESAPDPTAGERLCVSANCDPCIPACVALHATPDADPTAGERDSDPTYCWAEPDSGHRWEVWPGVDNDSGLPLGYMCRWCTREVNEVPRPAEPDADDASEPPSDPTAGERCHACGREDCANSRHLLTRPRPARIEPPATPDADDASTTPDVKADRLAAIERHGSLPDPDDNHTTDGRCKYPMTCAADDAIEPLTDAEREALLSVERDEDAVAVVERIVAAREAAAATKARAEGWDEGHRGMCRRHGIVPFSACRNPYGGDA